MHACGVRVDVNGDGFIKPSPARPTSPCRGVAKYSALLLWPLAESQRIGLCEEHAFEARYPKGSTRPVSSVDLGVLEIRSLPREVYRENVARAELSALAA